MSPINIWDREGVNQSVMFSNNTVISHFEVYSLEKACIIENKQSHAMRREGVRQSVTNGHIGRGPKIGQKASRTL